MGVICSGNPVFSICVLLSYFHIDKARARNWDSMHSSCPDFQQVGCQLKLVVQLLIFTSEPKETFSMCFTQLHPEPKGLGNFIKCQGFPSKLLVPTFYTLGTNYSDEPEGLTSWLDEEVVRHAVSPAWSVFFGWDGPRIPGMMGYWLWSSSEHCWTSLCSSLFEI